MSDAGAPKGVLLGSGRGPGLGFGQGVGDCKRRPACGLVNPGHKARVAEDFLGALTQFGSRNSTRHCRKERGLGLATILTW